MRTYMKQDEFPEFYLYFVFALSFLIGCEDAEVPMIGGSRDPI